MLVCTVHFNGIDISQAQCYTDDAINLQPSVPINSLPGNEFSDLSTFSNQKYLIESTNPYYFLAYTHQPSLRELFNVSNLFPPWFLDIINKG